MLILLDWQYQKSTFTVYFISNFMFSFYQNVSMESEKTQTHRNQIQKNHPTSKNKTGTEIYYIQVT